MVLALTIALTVAVALVGWLTVKHRARIAELGAAIEAEAEIVLTGIATLRDRVQQREDDAEGVAALRAEVAALLAETGQLAEQTAAQRNVIYKMSKALNRDVAVWAHETRAEAERAIEEGRCLRDDAGQLQAKTSAFFNDDGLKRYLRRQEEAA